MADIFTDGPVFEQDQGTVPESVAPAPAVQPAATPVPVPYQQDTVANQTDTSGSSPDTAGQEPGQGVEEVPDADYTVLLEQLIQQNEKQQELMETLVRENKKLEQDIKNIQNAMPSMMCMLGVIIGVLLLHILASYIRP